MYDSAKDRQVDDDILKRELTKCCKARQGFHKGEWICFCCGMVYKKEQIMNGAFVARENN